jgi:hypothetical protein
VRGRTELVHGFSDPECWRCGSCAFRLANAADVMGTSAQVSLDC